MLNDVNIPCNVYSFQLFQALVDDSNKEFDAVRPLSRQEMSADSDSDSPSDPADRRKRKHHRRLTKEDIQQVYITTCRIMYANTDTKRYAFICPPPGRESSHSFFQPIPLDGSFVLTILAAGSSYRRHKTFAVCIAYKVERCEAPGV